MKVIDHNFLYSSFHPDQDNIVICLERNHYPKDMEIFDLNVKKEEVEEVKEEEKKAEPNLVPKVPNLLAQMASGIAVKDKADGDNEKGAEAETKIEETQGVPFEVEKEVVYESAKEKATEGEHKYAISYWDTNPGGSPF